MLGTVCQPTKAQSISDASVHTSEQVARKEVEGGSHVQSESNIMVVDLNLSIAW